VHPKIMDLLRSVQLTGVLDISPDEATAISRF